MTLRFIVVLALAALASCSYDIEDELFPDDECNTQDIGYLEDIVPILESGCYACHNSTEQAGGVVVDNYEKMMPHLESGRLLGSIQHLPGFSPMPQGRPMLPLCEIRKLISWIDAGYPNN